MGVGSGNDTVYAGAGNDVVYGDSELAQGTGADTIDGGDGDDILYGDSRVASGSGADKLDGGDGADILFGDSQLGVGSGNDTIYGGSGNDVLYGDSQEGPGSGNDVLTGDDGDDQIFGDSYTAQGSGDDVIVGGWGQDLLVGDSYEGTGTGSDRIDGGYDNDVVYGDSVQADGSGNDIILGGDGDDTLVGDSDTGKGSGCDWLDGGAGNDIMYGDSRSGEGIGHDMLIGGEGDDLMYGDTGGPIGLGHDTLVVGPGTDTPAGAGQEFDTIIQADGQAPSYSYEVNGYTAQYRQNAATGAVEAHNNQFNSWDVVGERYWDQAHNAWVTNMGASVTVEYADKTLLYNNYGTDIKIKQDGSWQPYNPDDHYRVEYREDPETGKLLVYNNDLGTWDPYMEEYQPDGANYTVLNEGNTIQIKYADGSVVMLENYGDGAWLNAAETGHHWVQLPGQQVFRDSTGIWYSYGWGQWSYSIDTCATWKDVSMLDIRVVQNGSGTVDAFDGHSWAHSSASLEFFDKNYAMSGWHKMNQFYVELYDGIGYDGQPLEVVHGWETPQSSDPDAPAVLNTLMATGQQQNPPPDGAVITGWKTWVYGEWSHSLVTSYQIPNPSSDYRPEKVSQSLNLFFQADDTFDSERWDALGASLGTNVIFRPYDHDGYSLQQMVKDLSVIQYVTTKGSTVSTDVQIENLMILNHGDSIGLFRVGTDRVDPYNFYARDYDKLFAKLDPIMSDAAQIQHYGCLQAGPNPYDPAVTAHDYDGSIKDRFKPGTLANLAWKGRCMFATIAQLTGATVFASSDANGVRYDQTDDCGLGFPHYDAPDMCLEFGIAPDGSQVDFQRAFHDSSTSGTALWNLEKRYYNFSRIVSMQDADYDFPGPESALDYYLPEVPNYGESFPEGVAGTKYLPLKRGPLW